ncbi:hypothetical protein HK100_000801 [Physocladia obscura]|uniref:Uncharacterized protein n=1 Tax=Physocladia obscura TaxID=109957 RepID=A0AAD5T0E8_9FUNG|nr:hypothetical protein HK100_000801 [Physocladia obscura]
MRPTLFARSLAVFHPTSSLFQAQRGGAAAISQANVSASGVSSGSAPDVNATVSGSINNSASSAKEAATDGNANAAAGGNKTDGITFVLEKELVHL